jgi:hypothetical protein
LWVGRGDDTRGLVEQMGWHPQSAVRQYQLGVVSDLLVEDHARRQDRRRLENHSEASADLLHALTAKVGHLLPPSDRGLAAGGLDASWPLMMRTAFQQFPDVENVNAPLAEDGSSGLRTYPLRCPATRR